ncbi:MAG TPA: hypothetical protein P5263_09165, partial [Methanoregulaceae archaeon]|nr:hypothetical protein [Methanoregulaceae archaeon]
MAVKWHLLCARKSHSLKKWGGPFDMSQIHTQAFLIHRYKAGKIADAIFLKKRLLSTHFFYRSVWSILLYTFNPVHAGR